MISIEAESVEDLDVGSYQLQVWETDSFTKHTAKSIFTIDVFDGNTTSSAETSTDSSS